MSPSPPRPLLLDPENFTPPSRTPWGGRRILEVIKADQPLSKRKRAYAVVGESWELSVEPDFPSTCGGEPLASLFQQDPAGYLGEEAKEGGTALLVKLLDAAAPLSLQIHPHAGYAGLGEGESGKPESWYVAHAEPGAGLYLGFREGIDEPEVKRALTAGEDLSALLCFVPAAVGDFFLIEAGTPHAVGPGLTLVEPQRVRPGERGVTYRYWDWNRLYDAEGRRSPEGAPRALHLAEALAVTRWERPGPRILEEARLRAGMPSLCGPATYLPLAGAPGSEHGGLCSSAMEIGRLSGTGRLLLPPAPTLRALVVLEGEVRLEAPGLGAPICARGGRSLALPAGLPSLEISLDGAHAILARALG